MVEKNNPDIFYALAIGFQKATQRVYHSPATPSKVELRRLGGAPQKL